MVRLLSTTTPKRVSRSSRGRGTVKNKPTPVVPAFEALFNASKASADGATLIFEHTIQDEPNRRLVMFTGNLGVDAPGDYATLVEEEDFENEFGANSVGPPAMGIAFYVMVASPVGDHEITVPFRVATTDASAIALNLTNIIQGESYENIMYAADSASSGTIVSGVASSMNQYGGGTVSSVSTGDTMLLGAIVEPAETLTPGEGFALVDSVDVSDGDARLFVWTKTADDGAATTFAFGKTEGAIVSWIVVAFAPASP